MTLSNHGELQVLDEIFNAGAGTFPGANPFVSLHTADPGETSGNESAGGSYARQQADFTVAAGGTLENVAAITFAGMAAGDVVGWGIWDAVTGGNSFVNGWFSTVSRIGVVDAAGVTGNDVISPAHGFTTDNRVVFEVVEAEIIPAGLTAGTVYFVLAAGLTTDTFRVSTTSGGAAIDITAKGSSIVRQVIVTTLQAGNTFQINAGALDIFAE